MPILYAWNAVRKIYELLRLLQAGSVTNTLEVVQDHPEILRLAVSSANPDGTIPWGPFSWGGAIICGRRGLVVVTAFSVWKQDEDHKVAARAANWQLNMVVPE